MSGVKRAVVEAYSPLEVIEEHVHDEARALMFQFFPELRKGHVVSRTDNKVIDVKENSGQVFFRDTRYYLGRAMFESTKGRMATKVAQVSDAIADLLEEQMPTPELLSVELDTLVTYSVNNRQGRIRNLLALRSKSDEDCMPNIPNFVKALQDALSTRTSPMLDRYEIAEDFYGAVPLASLTDDIIHDIKYKKFLNNVAEFLPINGVVQVGGEVGSVGESTPTIIEMRS